MANVKGVSSEKARQTRRSIREAAHALFIEQGYGTTTLKEVAARAGVAVQTIYFTFGNKRTLLKEVVDVAIAGDDEPVATLDRDWFQASLATETASDHLRAHVESTCKVLARVAPIIEVVSTAVAMDPEVRTLWPQDIDPRVIVSQTAAKSLMNKPGARQDVTADEAADIIFGLLSPELYLLLVRDRQWSPERFSAWAHATLSGQLCELGTTRIARP